MLTYQDFINSSNIPTFIDDAIISYKSSEPFIRAVEAESYFNGDNSAISNRPKWSMRKSGKSFSFSNNITSSNFFFRFVVQQNQFLLANGLQTNSLADKAKLGPGFDKTLEAIGEKALIHGVSWGFWNLDHLEHFPAVSNNGNHGFFPLLDEHSGSPMLGIRFWQLHHDKPLVVQLFDNSGFSLYNKPPNASMSFLKFVPYINDLRSDSFSNSITASSGYSSLPIFPLYANDYHRSEFTRSIKSKIDLFDKILSDFGDNLERTNDVYWVINNFGGSTDEIKEMLAEIEELKATYVDGDGASATPHTIEVPFAARKTALDLLERALYADFMALNLNDISGGSLTNVAIHTAAANLKMKANRFEWQVFLFCQKLLSLLGINTENIKFRRQSISNDLETMQIVSLAAPFLDPKTILEKIPIVEPDEVDIILNRLSSPHSS